MAITIVRPNDPLPEKNINFCVYAEPGTGKTTSSFTAESPLHLDFDEGLERAAYRKTSIKIRNTMHQNGKIKSTGYGDLKQMIMKGEFSKLIFENGFKTVIIDTGGTLLDDHITPYLTNSTPKYRRGDGSLSLQGFGALKNEYKWFVNQIKGLNLDVFVVCHAAEKDEKVRPKMTGGSLDILKETADMLGYMYMEGNRRMINFNPTEKAFGKNVAQLDVLEVPHYQTPEFYDFFARIIDTSKKKMSELSDEQKEAIETIESVKKGIKDSVDLEELEDAFADAMQLDKIYKVQAEKLYADKHLELYTELHFKTQDNIKGLNAAMQNIPENVRESWRKAHGTALVHHAKTLGFIWKKSDNSFIKKES